jgi:Flp pilus assembly protein TadG
MSSRKGSVLVLVVVLLPFLMAILALAVDLGTLYSTRSQLQAAVDAAALAGASGLSAGREEAISRAIACARLNRVNGTPVELQESNVELGQWDPSTRTVIDPPGALWPSAIKVTTQAEVSFALAGIFGIHSSHASTSAVAVVGARDIMLTLDYSGSMCYDSLLMRIDRLGKPQVETALQNIWVDFVNAGAVSFPSLTRDLAIPSSTFDAQILSQLGLTGKAWPAGWGGSWSGYFNYVRQLGGPGRDRDEEPYRYHYGYLTLMNYLQDSQRGSRKTPGLAGVREQPIHAMKEAVSIFRDFMEDPKTDDRLGLAAYTYSDGTGVCEVPLTYDYDDVSSTLNDRQAAHYYEYTNIAGGMTKARQELENNGREVALKLIVLLTDGQANRPGDVTTAKQAARTEAVRAKNEGIPIVTISLGSEADTGLMQYIADTTGGVHFIVPGGSSPQDYKDQLVEVFANIAGHRPVKLVQ